MRDVFVSYTRGDPGWAFWIGQELEKLGDTAHLHDWEISAGGDIAAWRCQSNGGSSTRSATAISRATIYAARARRSAKAAERLCL